nr:MAG TPA: vitelline envelope receptor [Caudoviricetes sp.]
MSDIVLPHSVHLKSAIVFYNISRSLKWDIN